MTTEQTSASPFTEDEWSSMAAKLHSFAESLSTGEQAAFASHLRELLAPEPAVAHSPDAADVVGFGGLVYVPTNKPWLSGSPRHVTTPIQTGAFHDQSLPDLTGSSWPSNFPKGWPYW